MPNQTPTPFNRNRGTTKGRSTTRRPTRRPHAGLFIENLELRRLLATFVPNSFLDEIDLTPGNGVVDTASGDITLRAAIMEANALAGSDTITLGAGTYELTIAGGLENVAATGDLDISGDLIIRGAGAGITIVDANGLDRIFQVLAGATVEMSGLTLTGGYAQGVPTAGSLDGWSGGGIANGGNLEITDSVITGNRANEPGRSGDGGGIFNSGGTLSLLRVTLSDNRCEDTGGGLRTNGAGSAATITDSTVSLNLATRGGGLAITNASTLTVTNSDIFGNSATSSGGGIHGVNAGSIATITDSTISDNTGGSGGGLTNSGGSTFNVVNTTISGNETLTSNGGGILSTDAGTKTTIIGSTVSGNDGFNGGGFYNVSGSTLTVENSTISENLARGGGGGGILSSGAGTKATFTGSTVSDNRAINGGGFVNTQGSTMTVANCTISGNFASNSGGGLGNNVGSPMTVANCTISGNEATGGGGGINSNGVGAITTITDSTISDNTGGSGGGLTNAGGSTLTVVNTTISGNSAQGAGGIANVISLSGVGVVKLTNTTMANNVRNKNVSPSPGDIDNYQGGTFTIQNSISASGMGFDGGVAVLNSLGNNIFVNTTYGSGFHASDLLEVDPMLGPLQDNGGPTETHALLLGSPAIDGANTAAAPDHDQRNAPRPRGAEADIGAFEILIAQNDSYTLAEDSALTADDADGSVGGSNDDGVFVNDTDATDDVLTAILVDDVDHGVLVLNADGTFTYTPFADYYGPDSFSYTADDGLAESNVATVSINVTPVNDDPVITSLGNSSPGCGGAAEGDVVTVSATFTDVDSGDTHTALIDWGDGTSSPGTVVNGSVTGSHVYAQGGIFTIGVTVTDNHGGSDSATTSSVITGVGLSQGVLYVIGTESKDQVQISRDGNQLKVVAEFAGTKIERSFTTANVQRIHVELCKGEDQLQIGGDVLVAAYVDGGRDNDQIQGGGGNDTVYGGEGNDQIQDSAGNNFINGGAGNDQIQGGSGRDVLIGGLGADNLSGSNADDILIAGYTDHDNDPQAILQIMAEWTRTDASFAVRVAHLSGTQLDGLNGTTFLNANTVHDDGAADQVDALQGGSGNDWYIYDLASGDKASGLSSLESQHDITNI